MYHLYFLLELWLEAIQKTFILVGYSFGASVVPFTAANLSEALKEKLKGVYALSPDVKADFEIHISDMLSLESSKDNYDVISEMNNQRV